MWQSHNRNGARTVPVCSAFTTGRMSGSSKVKTQSHALRPVALQICASGEYFYGW